MGLIGGDQLADDTIYGQRPSAFLDRLFRPLPAVGIDVSNAVDRALLNRQGCSTSLLVVFIFQSWLNVMEAQGPRET